MFNSLHTFSGFHLAHRPPILTAILVCHIYLVARALSVCVCECVSGGGLGGGGIWRWCGGSLHTSILSPAAHPVEKLALITAVCLSHQHAPLPTQIESNHRQLLKGGAGALPNVARGQAAPASQTQRYGGPTSKWIPRPRPPGPRLSPTSVQADRNSAVYFVFSKSPLVS